MATPTASGKRSEPPSLQDVDIATLRRIESCTGDTRSTVNLSMANKALNHDFESEILHLRTFKRCEAAIAHWLDWIHRDATGFWSRVHEDNVDQIKWSLRLITNQLRRAKLRLSMSKYMQLRGVWRSQRFPVQSHDLDFKASQFPFFATRRVLGCHLAHSVGTSPRLRQRALNKPSLRDLDVETMRRIEGWTGQNRSTVNFSMANRALHHALESEVLQLRTFKLCETALALWLDWIDNDGESGFWNKVDEDAVEQIRCSLSTIVSQLNRAKLRRRCADAQFVPVRPLTATGHLRRS